MDKENKEAYVAPTAELTAEEATLGVSHVPEKVEKESPSEIILQALKCFAADIERQMALEEEAYFQKMRSMTQKLEQISVIMEGMA